MQLTVKQAECNSITIKYIDNGKMDAPVLLFLHSIKSTKELFETVLPAFTDQYRVIALDLRGHGNSSKVGPYTFAQLVEDIRQLLDHEQIKKATIIAASFSSVPAQMFAVAYPERVNKLVLLDGGFYNLSEIPGFDIERVIKASETLSFESLEDAEEAFSKRYGEFGATPELVKYELERRGDGRFSYKLPNDAFASYFHEYGRVDKEELFPRVQCQVLLLLADEGTLPDPRQQEFFVTAANKYLQMVPTARLVKIPYSLHLLVVTHPKETVQQIKNFLTCKKICTL